MKTNNGRLVIAALAGFMLVVLVRGVAGCSSGESTEAEAAVPPVTEEVAVVTDETPEPLPDGIVDLNNANCPVMGGAVMEGVYVDWDGLRVHFCCAGCDQAFLADPESYLEILADEPAVAEILESRRGEVEGD